MPNSSTAGFHEIVQALLNEDQLFSLRDKRANSRQSFVRNVSVVFFDQPGVRHTGFTRDLSENGIGLIHKFEVEDARKALITIHRLWDQPIVLKCETCWCSSSEPGWYNSGWTILSVETPLA